MSKLYPVYRMKTVKKKGGGTKNVWVKTYRTKMRSPIKGEQSNDGNNRSQSLKSLWSEVDAQRRRSYMKSVRMSKKPPKGATIWSAIKYKDYKEKNK